MRKPTLQQRIRAKSRSQSLLVGLTWYTKETWAEVRASATDPECFEDSFEKWEAMAISARREFQRSGVRAIECLIVPQDFAAWCALNGEENNASSRAAYVSDKLTSAQGGG